MDVLFYVFGLAICLCVLVQLTLWTTATLVNVNHNRKQLEASRLLIREQIGSVRLQTGTQGRGFRPGMVFENFMLIKLEKPADGITSVYLKPIDDKPIPSFKSGQHLSLKFHVPGQPKPLVRCYSLSSGPRDDFYRISVKAIPAPPSNPELTPGRVSNFINSQLMVGDTVAAKAPSGSFVLNQLGEYPIVLMAGGIGITPIFSMLEDLAANQSDRTIVLLYGVKFGREHAFKDQIARIAQENKNVHVVNCYSHPEESDQLGTDFQYQGWISVELLKKLLPDNRCMYYLCGPPPFMESLQQGLAEWGVPENRIHYEAFGPATIKKAKSTPVKATTVKSNIEFARAGKQIDWNPEFESILDLAEANDLVVDSGCRAGSCKTCSIPLIEGKVQYPDGMEVDCEMGECLPCIAIPDGDVKLDA